MLLFRLQAQIRGLSLYSTYGYVYLIIKKPNLKSVLNHIFNTGDERYYSSSKEARTARLHVHTSFVNYPTIIVTLNALSMHTWSIFRWQWKHFLEGFELAAAADIMTSSSTTAYLPIINVLNIIYLTSYKNNFKSLQIETSKYLTN